MHRTATVDYIVVLSGEIYAIVDGGETLLKPGDVLTFAAGSKHSLEQKGKDPLVILATWSANFDPTKDTMKHEMDHAKHRDHAVTPAAATSRTRK